MMKSFLLYLLISLTFFIACGPQVTLIVDRPPKPKLSTNDPVLIYFEGENLPAKPEKIGRVTASTTYGNCDPDKTIEKLEKKARSIGANAIVINKLNPYACMSFSGDAVFMDIKRDSTQMTEEILKQDWLKDFDPVEGIYESAANNEDNGLLKLAAFKDKNNELKLIYLSGIDSSLTKYWKEGDIKAELTRTATPTTYKAKWINNSRSYNDNVFISFEGGLLKVIDSKSNIENIFLKLYPTDEILTLSSGSGFAISGQGYIVTNHHVIKGANNINVRGLNGDFNSKHSARVIVSDERNDLAIIKIDSLKKPLPSIPFSLKSELSDVGNEIFVLGYPLRATMGDELKLTNGLISSKTGYQGDITSYQISAPVQPGNSGGPTFDSSGNLVGVVNAKHLGAENVTYSVKANYLNNLFELLPDDAEIQFPPEPESGSLSELVNRYRNFVYIIEVN